MAQYKLESLRAGYEQLWAAMRVVQVQEAQAQARRIIANKGRYQTVEKMVLDRAGKIIPWFVIGMTHMRESGGRFDRWLHNGDRMMDDHGRPIRTVQVPAGRPLNPNCSWEEGAFDALITVQHLGDITSAAQVAYSEEGFNGWGYRNPNRNIPSPYLWAGTSVQKRGKFDHDGHYDKNLWDPQIGCMAVLKEILAIYPDARFAPVPPPGGYIPPKPSAVPQAPAQQVPIPRPAPAPDPELENIPHSPRADDTASNADKPLDKSKTFWGGILQYVTGLLATVAAMFQYIATPWGFAAFVVILLFLTLGIYLVVKGRLDVRKVIQHLAEDQ